MTQSVFLIHDALEKPFARQLAIVLSLAGATVWLDEGEIGGAQNSLIGKIEKEFPGDICLVIILSPNSVRSDWIRHEDEIALNWGAADGVIVNVLPLLYKDCAIPAFMADKLCADFRDPANHPSMLRRLIRRLDLDRNGKESILPANLAGMWQGEWRWCGRQRKAEMFLSASVVPPSKMIIRYQKSGILTIVEQKLDVRVSANSVKLNGTSYRLIERGISLGWILDTFHLSLGATGRTLEGINTDKKGTHYPVLFKRK